MPNLKVISQKQFLVTIEGLTAYFTKASAPKQTRDEEEWNDGQTGMTRVHLSFIKNEKITLSKSYDPAADKALVTWYKDTFKTGKRFSVSIQPVDADMGGSPIQGASTLVLTEAQLVSFKYPEVDRNGSGVAMLELELVYEDCTMQ